MDFAKWLFLTANTDYNIKSFNFETALYKSTLLDLVLKVDTMRLKVAVRLKVSLTMLISEIVSMLAISKLMPTVTGPSRNKEETSDYLLYETFTR